MTDHPHDPEIVAVTEYARDYVRAGIAVSLGRLATDYFTAEELSQAEVAHIFLDPEAPGFPDDPDEHLSPEDISRIVKNVLNRTAGEVIIDDMEDTLDQPEDLDSYRESEAMQALTDYYDVKLYVDTGMSLEAALEEVLKLRQSDIDAEVGILLGSYRVAKRLGFAVPDTLQEWMTLKRKMDLS